MFDEYLRFEQKVLLGKKLWILETWTQCKKKIETMLFEVEQNVEQKSPPSDDQR